MFAAGSNEEIRFGRVTEREVWRQIGFGNRPRRLRPLLQHAIDRLNQIPAPAVVGCYRKREPGVVAGEALGLTDEIDKPLLEAVTVADNAEADPLRVQPGHFVLQANAKSSMRVRISPGTLPFSCERDRLRTRCRAPVPLNHRARLDPRLWRPCGAGHAARPRPLPSLMIACAVDREMPARLAVRAA